MSYGTVQAEKMTTESGYSLGAGNASSFKNRIINGNMNFAQRSAGPVTNTTANSTIAYETLDRWGYWAETSGKFSVQQSSVAPPGYTNSALITSLTALSVPSTAYYTFSQRIEGNNFADFGFGTANAKSIIVSFWVRSSLTGTFPCYLFNSNYSRSFASNFTINAANTWEQKTIAVAGDTSGTWLTSNNIGIEFGITFAGGSNWFSTANTWTSTSFGIATSGCTNLLATNGATMYITGVQLEAGTVATSFDFRSYGIETMLCRRYYQKYTADTGTGQTYFIAGNVYSSTLLQCPWQGMGVPFRTSPTLTSSGSFTLLNGATGYSVTPSNIANPNSDAIGVTNFQIQMTGSGLPTGSFGAVLINSSGAYLGLSAEL